MAKREEKFILWFKEISIEDVNLVGGKNASLGEMYQQLITKGVKIPNGFAITAHSYYYFLRKAGISQKIQVILQGLDVSNIRDLQQRAYLVRSIIEGSKLPDDLEMEIIIAYHQMESEYGNLVDCAVRSSATAEGIFKTL
jgi:pyruvate, water dikinase